MTLEEAIKHCEKEAEQFEKTEKYRIIHTECGAGRYVEEHRQLADWLEELKDYRGRTVATESASEKEKLKAEVNGYFYSLNAAGKIDWSTYSTLYDVCISIIEKHYDRMEKGRRAESEKEMNNKRAVTTEKDQKIGKWRYDGKTLICSICNTWFHITDRTTYMRRCPYCGAKMESKETTE